MTKFKITWPNGSTEEDVSTDSATPDAYAMQRWGCDTADDVYTRYDVLIQLAEAIEAVPMGDATELPVSEVIDGEAPNASA